MTDDTELHAPPEPAALRLILARLTDDADAHSRTLDEIAAHAEPCFGRHVMAYLAGAATAGFLLVHGYDQGAAIAAMTRALEKALDRGDDAASPDGGDE